jgi:lipopolysaccharide export LptBFGC system permease protein LptF
MIIYTRGVDRVTKKAPFNSPISAIVNYAAESAAFSGADNLWEKMQEKLSKHINDNGGNASIIEAKKYRPNYSIVKSYLKNQATLQSLGCN